MLVFGGVPQNDSIFDTGSYLFPTPILIFGYSLRVQNVYSSSPWLWVFLFYISKNDIQILDPWVFGYEKCWLAQIFKGPKRWQERQSGEAAPAEKASKLSKPSKPFKRFKAKNAKKPWPSKAEARLSRLIWTIWKGSNVWFIVQVTTTPILCPLFGSQQSYRKMWRFLKATFRFELTNPSWPLDLQLSLGLHLGLVNVCPSSWWSYRPTFLGPSPPPTATSANHLCGNLRHLQRWVLHTWHQFIPKTLCGVSRWMSWNSNVWTPGWCVASECWLFSILNDKHVSNWFEGWAWFCRQVKPHRFSTPFVTSEFQPEPFPYPINNHSVKLTPGYLQALLFGAPKQ